MAPEDLLVDLAVEAPPILAATVSILGPTFAPEELAARKVLALFDRAAARDFADVYELSERYDRPTLFRLARDQDAGLVPGVLAEMIGYLDRYSDADLPMDGAHVSNLRHFFAEWAQALREEAADGLDETRRTRRARVRDPRRTGYTCSETHVARPYWHAITCHQG